MSFVFSSYTIFFRGNNVTEGVGDTSPASPTPPRPSPSLHVPPRPSSCSMMVKTIETTQYFSIDISLDLENGY